MKKKNKDRDVLNCAGGADAKVDIKDKSWYVSLFTTGITEISRVSEYINCRVPTELVYIGRPVISENVLSKKRTKIVSPKLEWKMELLFFRLDNEGCHRETE